MSSLTTIKVDLQPEDYRREDLAQWLDDRRRDGHIILIDQKYLMDMPSWKMTIVITASFADPQVAMEFKLAFC